MATCLDGFVGLTKDICECLPQTTSTDVISSTSGLYVDSLLSNCIRFKYKDCNTTDLNFWENMIAQKRDSEKTALTELTALYSNKIEANGRVALTIGLENQNSTYYDVTDGIAKLTLDTDVKNRQKGQLLNIERLGLLTSTSKFITITVKKDGTQIIQYTMNINALSTKTNVIKNVSGVPEPLVLPLDGSVYELSYPVGEDFYPMNNTLSCCGAQPLSPWFNNLQKYANGFMLVGDVTCPKGNVICHLIKFDELMNPIAQYVQHKIALDALDRLIIDGPFTAMSILKSADAMKTRRNAIEEKLALLAETILKIKFYDFKGTCYSCKSFMSVHNRFL